MTKEEIAYEINRVENKLTFTYKLISDWEKQLLIADTPNREHEARIHIDKYKIEAKKLIIELKELKELTPEIDVEKLNESLHLTVSNI